MTRWWTCAIGAALALTACGKSGSSTDAAVGARPTAGPDHGRPDPGKGAPDEHPSAPCDHVTVRVVGTNPGDVSELALLVKGVEAIVRGTPLAVRDAHLGGPMSLCDGGRKDLGTFDLPDGADDLVLRLWLGGGKAHKGSHDGDLDHCTGPLVFHVDRWRIIPGVCELVVEVNVARSVAMDGDGLAFLPHVRVF